MHFFYSGLISVALILTGVAAGAQSKITVRLIYNSTQSRYEVYGRPNFTTSNFSFGPSQISVVLPATAPDDPLTVQSIAAGTWFDNSIVLKPIAAPQADFHGISTQGGKANLTESQDLLLLSFALKQGLLNGTRLFINGTDPDSDKPGMLGGDFRIYLSDSKGINLAVVDPTAPGSSTTTNPGTSTTTNPGTSTTTNPGTSTTTNPGTSTTTNPGTSTTTNPGTSTTTNPGTSTTTNAVILAVPASIDPGIRVVAYPNPAMTGEVQLQFTGLTPTEPLTVQILTLEGKLAVEVIGRVDELSRKIVRIPGIYKGVLLIRITRINSSVIYQNRFLVDY